MRTIFYKAWLLATLLFYFGTTYLFAERLEEGIEYKVETSAIVSNGDFAPFWMTNNKYGLSTTKNNSGYLRAGIFRDAKIDNNKDWCFGYGADIAVPFGMPSNFILQQIYGDFQWKALRLNIGQKERPLELKNQMLSSGGMTSGINARPIPQIRLELPDFWTIPGTKNWAAVKAHIAYGWYTDNAWQREFTQGTNSLFTANSLHHSKAGFLRIGNTTKFPITLTGGLEMACQFGGEGWNVTKRLDDKSNFDNSHVIMGHGLKNYYHAFIPGGSDQGDADYKNTEGNHLGSWHGRLDFHANQYKIGVYAEHFFEDHSQMFLQYGWKDMLYGIEFNLVKNPFVTSLLYEHTSTTDQSGGIYHDATPNMPEQISGVDNYYNNGMYGGWHHSGFALGSPLLISPIYNKDSKIYFYHNRIKAHHLGLCGNPSKCISYKILYTHIKSLGTYLCPLDNPKYGDFLYAEISFSPKKLQNLTITAAYGQNMGNLLSSCAGGNFTLAYSGLFNKRNK